MSNLTSAEWHKRKASQLGGVANRIRNALGETTTVGNAPEGYGAVFEWDRKEKEIGLVIFVNSKDSCGVCIKNVQNGDTLRVTSASGICSTNDGIGGLISSIVGAVSTIGGLIAPKAKPFIEAGKKFAEEQFGKSNKSDERDPFGQDPGNGDWCQDEGGVLVCLPRAAGTFYAYNGLKRKEPRFPENYPDHIEHAFFLLRHKVKRDFGIFKEYEIDDSVLKQPRTIEGDGEIFVLMWDSEFPDNQGYYEVHLVLSRP
jgi:hypothetical protein